MKKINILLLIMLNVCATHGFCSQLNFNKTYPWWFPQNITISGAILGGPIGGFVQIPAGGTDGTTSLRRPLFSELGIYHSYNYDFNTIINWKNLSIYGGYNYIRPNGSTTLDKGVITHDVYIPAGTHLNSKLKFDYYNLGAKYNFYSYHNKLMLTPIIETDLMSFDYEIPNYIEPRAFDFATFRVGITGTYYFKPQFYFDSSFITSIPVFNLNIVTAEAKLNYNFFSKSHISPTLFIGSKYSYIDLLDHQETPNHISSNQISLLTGLSIKFSS